MAGHTKVEEDPKELAHAQTLWGNFVTASKWVIIISCLILIAMAAAFVPFGS